MLTAKERLELIQAKVERAYKHIDDVHNTLKIFGEAKPYTVIAKSDLQTKKITYFVFDCAPIPVLLNVQTGDAIHNLRASFDYLAQQLYLVGTGTEYTAKHIHFPFDISKSQFDSALRKKVQGMRQDAIDAIRALEPYKGGNGEKLWVLSQLDNIDKHRLLITVGSAFKSVDVISEFAGAFGDDPIWDDLKRMSLFISAADKLCPLEHGDELYIGGAQDKFDEHKKFKFEIALHESGLVEAANLLKTLHDFHNLVRDTISAFEPCLA